MTLPSADELRDLAQHSLDACGVDAALLAGDSTSRTPVLGTDLLPVSWATASEVDGAVGRAVDAFAVTLP